MRHLELLTHWFKSVQFLVADITRLWTAVAIACSPQETSSLRSRYLLFLAMLWTSLRRMEIIWTLNPGGYLITKVGQARHLHRAFSRVEPSSIAARVRGTKTKTHYEPNNKSHYTVEGPCRSDGWRES